MTYMVMVSIKKERPTVQYRKSSRISTKLIRAHDKIEDGGYRGVRIIYTDSFQFLLIKLCEQDSVGDFRNDKQLLPVLGTCSI